MTTRHTVDYYLDGHVTVAFCKVCSAEGLKLLEDCPQEVQPNSKNCLDDKKQTFK